ncbi:MAG: glycosyltransferase family 4 protein [Patescibacteria group bacterium]|nr:glycosyltransferase family 4 protein [Patescibacteria group bacterium]
MKIAFIHNEKKLGTGAHYINDLMSLKLKGSGLDIKNFYPKTSLVDTPVHLGGLKSILFFYSLLERRREILKFNVIQGTTYTPLPFLAYPVPVVSHFGSTTRGFLNSTPMANKLENGCKKIWYRLKKDGVISELNIKTRRPMRDIADIEEYVASRATAVVATSENVRTELLTSGVKKEKIQLIHNAIEDYWLEPSGQDFAPEPSLVFLGRLGGDAFTLKLKGLDRLINFYQHFPNVPKITFCMTKNQKLTTWLHTKISHSTVFSNTGKDKLPELIRPLRGSILFIPSRYEGFSLSLIEGMSQGLVPIVYPIGVAPEIIKNGENGFLVTSQAEAIEKAGQILKDKNLRESLSIGAMETSKQFSSNIIAKKLIELYKSIMPDPSRFHGGR